MNSIRSFFSDYFYIYVAVHYSGPYVKTEVSLVLSYTAHFYVTAWRYPSFDEIFHYSYVASAGRACSSSGIRLPND